MPEQKKESDLPRTPSGSPPSQPPLPPPLAGAYEASGSKASSSSKTVATPPQFMAWTTSDTRYESTGVFAGQESSLIDFMMNDDSVPDEQQKLEANPKGDQVRIDVSRPMPLGGLSGHVTIQTQFFFNKDLEYLRYGNKGMPNMVSLTGGLIDRSSILTDMILRRVEKKSEHTCGFSVSSASKATHDTGYEFKHDYTIIESLRAVVFPVDYNERKIMWFDEIYKFSDGTLTHILEALDYRVKEFKVKRLNPGMNTRFWTQKDVARSKGFIAAIERRPKTKRIYRNLKCFVGGRVRDIDYRLLQRTK
nr:hypothetical protein [Tanacetum cinerariifolium]